VANTREIRPRKINNRISTNLISNLKIKRRKK
jgi:hypothetical protein